MMANIAGELTEVSTSRGAADVLLTRVRLRALRRIAWMRSALGQPSESRAWVVSDVEVNQILEDPAEMLAREESFYRSDEEVLELGDNIRRVDYQFAELAKWNTLRQEFALSELEVNLLTLAVAQGIDPRLSRVYAYLHDDANAGHATPWLAASLFQTEVKALDSSSPLFLWRLATPADGASHEANAWSANTAWAADPQIRHWLLGRGGSDPGLAAMAIQAIPRNETASKICLYPEQLEQVQIFIDAIRSSSAELDGPIEIELLGEEGSGKRTLAAQCAAALGADLIAADAELLFQGTSPGQAAEAAVRVARMALLNHAAIYWTRAESVKQAALQTVPRSPRLVFFGVETESLAPARSSMPRRTFRLPAMRREMRTALWNRISAAVAPPMVEDWILTPAEIATAAQIAPAGMAAAIEVFQENLRGVSRELFVTLPCPFTWEDIVLAAHTREHLAELEQQVRHRWQVYEEWGFERLCSFGSGITAMFSGPSGTGKTMAAQVMARSLNLQLYRVDLSGVMNKYIGETEKRLKQVFDACERSNVLLFFDEADALFGQRTQVKDAHDRFANIEIDYLLQRMEQFAGIAILATNRSCDLDTAFLRRIRFMVNFQPPGPGERRILWQRALPYRSPRGHELLGEIQWDLLAHKLTMTGADIASAALNAAFLARAEGERIAMRHILHAARREMAKHGLMLRMGDWED